MRKLCEACGKPKVLFSSELEAKKFIKSKHNSATSTKLKPYFCASCNAWHLTHKTNR